MILLRFLMILWLYVILLLFGKEHQYQWVLHVLQMLRNLVAAMLYNLLHCFYKNSKDWIG